jgi:class 3 adenylate cyclase/glyoxylase-like metal-dependent hydrolase (beta-lactamase superfamily II)
MKRLDDTNPVQISEDIWWVGFADYESGFSNNPYLLVDQGEAVLFDPGPGHPFFKDLITEKIQKIVMPESIKYIVAQHQDPDICGLIPYIENLLNPNVVIMAHPRTSLFIPYYGARKSILPVGNGDTLELKSGRKLKFLHTPYVHSPGAMVTWDSKTNSLFSSDIFAAFDRNWNLYADEKYISLARYFLEHYVGSKEALHYVHKQISQLEIERILPQHGCVINEPDVIRQSLDLLLDVVPAQFLQDLNTEPSDQQKNLLLESGKEWLQYWLDEQIEATSLQELVDLAFNEGPATVSLLLDNITQRAREIGVANPMTIGRTHKWNNIQATETGKLMDSIRNRLMKVQYSMLYGGESNIDLLIQKRLQAFKTDVTIMFLDIRKFTIWSSSRSADEVVRMLNRVLELASRIINANGGRVNKILGDGLLAYFPDNKTDEIVFIAYEIQKAIEENDLLPIGIGCDYGNVIIGDIGENERLDYSLVGTTVNTASRMCDLAKKGQVVITRSMYDRMEASVKKDLSSLLTYTRIRTRVKVYDPEIEAIRFKVIDYPEDLEEV